MKMDVAPRDDSLVASGLLSSESHVQRPNGALRRGAGLYAEVHPPGESTGAGPKWKAGGPGVERPAPFR